MRLTLRTLMIAVVLLSATLALAVKFLSADQLEQRPRTVWWAPLGTIRNEELPDVSRRFAAHSIPWTGGGSRGAWGLQVPYEQHSLAGALLHGTPIEGRLATIVAGPRRGRLEARDDLLAFWTGIADFDPMELRPVHVTEELHAAGVECGIVRWPFWPRWSVNVPPHQADAARAALRASPIAGRVHLSEGRTRE